MEDHGEIDFDRFAAPEVEPEFVPTDVAVGLRRRAGQARRMGGEWHLALADELEEAAAGLDASAVDAHGVGAVEALQRFAAEVLGSYRAVAGHRWMVANAAGLRTWSALVVLALAGQSQKEIAGVLGVSKAAVCQLLRSLERSGSRLPAAIRCIAGSRREASADQREAGHCLVLAAAESRRKK